MNIKTLFLTGAIVASSGQYIQAQTKSHSFAGAREVWQGVRADLANLDGLIASKKLSEVHEAAFNLRDSARMLRGTSAGLSDVQKKVLGQRLSGVDALANELDATGDKNDLRGTVVNQRKMHLALDSLAGAFPSGALPPVGAVKSNGSVKDPVCRMTVDPATAPGKATYAGQTYYFCSVDESKAFQKSPARYAALYDDLAFGKPKNFAISLATSGQVAAGKPAVLSFAIREQGQNQLVRNFQLVHEKLMHLIVVSDDLSYFSHEHPQIGQDGRFRLKWTFPRAGRYLMFADFTPETGLNQVLRTQVTVGGAKPAALPQLTPDKTLSKTVDGYTISLRPSSPRLEAGKSSLLIYSITRGGKPVTDMQPYLGAMGHMMAINANGRDVVHTHTVGAGGSVTSAMATAKGPRFTFDLTPTAPGVTKIWAQFQRNGRVITVPFTFIVADFGLDNEEFSPVDYSNDATIVPAAKATQTKPQQVTIALPAGYREGAATVKAGKPVTLTFKITKDAGCGNTISVPSAKWTKTLKVGQSASVTFTPSKSGPLKFACGMDMFRGTLVVK